MSFVWKKCVVFSRPAEERLEIVECDLENQNMIRPAIANASIVICCIGASEKEVFDITGPYRIDYKATSNLIQEGKVQSFHQILVSFYVISYGPYSFLFTEVK